MKKSLVIQFIFGLALLGLGVYLSVSLPESFREQAEWWANNSLRASGTVVGTENEYRNRAYCEYPQIAFTAEDGKEYRFTTRGVMSYSVGTFPVGRKVAITYLKSNPAQAYLDSPSHDAATEVVSYALCGVLVLAGLALLYRVYRKRG